MVCLSNPIPNPSATETPPAFAILTPPTPLLANDAKKKLERGVPITKVAFTFSLLFFVISFLIRLLATLQPFCLCFCVVFDSDSCCFYYLDIFLLKIDISTTIFSLKLRVFAGRICSFFVSF